MSLPIQSCPRLVMSREYWGTSIEPYVIEVENHGLGPMRLVQENPGGTPQMRTMKSCPVEFIM